MQEKLRFGSWKIRMGGVFFFFFFFLGGFPSKRTKFILQIKGKEEEK